VPAIVRQLHGDHRCLVMGSDFPHAEGIAEPAEFVDLLDGLEDEAKRGIMRTNADTLFAR
jgi:predicted TIM-barrel fold metal-dependent hydrolase